MAKERVEYEVIGRDVGGSKAFKDVGDAAERAGDKVDKAGHDAEGAAKEYRGLASDIERAKAEMSRLATEISKTGNTDLYKDIRKQRSELRKLLDVSKILEEANPVGGGGGQAGKTGLLNIIVKEFLGGGVKMLGSGILSGVQSGVQSAGTWASENPWLATGIATGIVFGTPIIGAAITGAVGAGWIAGGIALAAHNPAVASAWTDLGHQAMAQLTSAADVFVEPLVKAAGTFGDTFGKIIPSVRADMATMAPYATELVGGVSGFVEKLMPGIDALTQQAGPVLHVLAQEAPAMGDALAHAMAYIAQGAPGGAAALHDILKVVEFLVETTGVAIMGFEHLYLELRAVGQAASGHWSDAKKSMHEAQDWSNKAGKDAHGAAGGFQSLGDALGGAGSAAGTAGTDFQTLAGQISATVLNTDTLSGQMVDKVLGSMMSMDQATLGFARSQTQLSDSIKQNGLQLDIHTAKGQANREAILASVQANVSQYDAMIRSGASADEASAAYNTNTAALEAQMHKAGFTQGAIDGLIGKYRNVPANVDTDVATHGLTEAIQGLDDTIRLANHLNGRVAVLTIEERHRTTYDNSVAPSSYFRGLATGGLRKAQVGMFIPPSDPGTVLTGEPQTGGEWLIPARGIDTRRAAMLGQAAMGAYGLDVVPKRSSSTSAPAAASAAPADLARVLEQAVERALTRALSRATLTIDDRTGRLGNLLSRAG